ncbi:MAG: NUDIX hydrolase [Zoogloeaceae bacterium]|nr:NUDIX hydrolase [Zoogloeaceae bacterium]
MDDEQKDTLEEVQLSSAVVYSGLFLNLFQDRVRCPDGREALREYVKHPGAVVVIPVMPDGKLLLERQFRYPVGRAFIEFPAGKIDPDESPLDCAVRELEEETGYRASSWTYLGRMHPCIGYSNEKIEIFLAQSLTYVGHQWDEGEFLEFVEMSLTEMEEAVLSGDITDSKTITALFWAERQLAGKFGSSTAP